ncbi:MAG: hypothetical protein M1503_09850 [Thaumarchaeota archaeon]|nr:hypothetical protein [Nitrososphaerota archaeon]
MITPEAGLPRESETVPETTIEPLEKAGGEKSNMYENTKASIERGTNLITCSLLKIYI